MKVRYARWETLDTEFCGTLERLATDGAVKRVCEVGGGANPALSLDFIELCDLEYLLLDSSREELAKAPAAYQKLEADAESLKFSVPGAYDLVVTKWVMEHLRRPREFHQNIFSLLREGGRAVHLFPTLFSFPFTFNRVAPERLTERMLLHIDPARRRGGREEKFRAYYKWCRGPTQTQRRRFERIGFRIEAYVGFFGHGYYEPVPWLHRAEQRIARALLRYPLPWLTDFSLVVLRRSE